MDETATPPATPTTAFDSAPTITVIDTSVEIANLRMTDETVARYIAMFPQGRRGEELIRAITLGVHGLVSTSMRATVDDMKHEVRRIIESAAAAADSHLGAALESGRVELAAHLDPDVRSSLTARTVAELQELHATMLARLDPDRSDSHTGKLMASITDLLGPAGLLAQRLEAAFDATEAESGFGRLLDTFERRFQEMRDLVVGNQQREAESARGTAKGVDFEDQVEDLLRREARALSGCVVERTGQVAGTLGAHTKVGDFVVVLPDGTTVAVEAKNTARIGLTGSTGILTELDQAMDNRNATWSICISHVDAYPGEVGSFAVYGNRILVVEEGDGTLTGVALRWIAAAALATAPGDDKIDAAAAMERLARIRDLAQHFSRSKKILTTAQSGLESVREDLDSLRSQLLELVDDISRALRPAAPTRRGVIQQRVA